MQQHRPFGIAGHKDARIVEFEGPLTGASADRSGFADVEVGEQLELGVSAAPFAVAVGAVGV